LQTRCNAGFEDAGDRFARRADGGFFFKERDERVLRVACDEEAVVV
jgi:hypothetical protein